MSLCLICCVLCAVCCVLSVGKGLAGSRAQLQIATKVITAASTEEVITAAAATIAAFVKLARQAQATAKAGASSIGKKTYGMLQGSGRESECCDGAL